MNEENIKSIITLQKISDELLYLIDNNKKNKEIKLNDILDKLYSRYEKKEPNYRNEHFFCNQYYFISSLYTYLVLPKETFFDNIPKDKKTNLLNDKWGINKLSPEYSLKDFLRRIRNAVSHGGITFTEKLDFTFTDINQKNKNDIFKVTLSAEELMKFTQALSYWCITKDIMLKDL